MFEATDTSNARSSPLTFALRICAAKPDDSACSFSDHISGGRFGEICRHASDRRRVARKALPSATAAGRAHRPSAMIRRPGACCSQFCAIVSNAGRRCSFQAPGGLARRPSNRCVQSSDKATPGSKAGFFRVLITSRSGSPTARCFEISWTRRFKTCRATPAASLGVIGSDTTLRTFHWPRS